MPFFARPATSESTLQLLPIPSFVITLIPPHPQIGPKFLRYGITYERKCVRISDTAPTDFNDLVEETSPSFSSDSDPVAVSPNPSSDLPIALQKGERFTANHHSIYNCLSYRCLSSSHYAFVSAIFSISSRKTVKEALSHPGWQQAIIDEMTALVHGSLFHFHLRKQQLVVSGFLLLK
ncbi:hypothetical protein QL285_069173 [Trifolium repens]|nr:hypothetical protein QL285_069173 [Trifolium repens]